VVEEIIYTSAEKGLKQGSRGFCTVISTNGMALNLAERLESMSGYRQAFPLHDPKASLNPVCWSHMTTRLAGRSLHVISRVADAGQDYTGRSNKLAHHLVIDNVASLISGPARMLAEPGVVADRWDGTVRHIPPRELRSAPMPATIPLVAWKALTGDEGWAGSVAEQLLQSPAPVSIIFDPGTDTLTLVREVLDLVPAAQRWNVTFTTYFTRLLAGAECQLRFVLNDTPEATSLRNDARARVIDLTSSLPAATGGTLVAMARQGQLTPQEVAPPQPITAARPRTSTEISTKDTGSEISIPKLKPGRSPLESTDRPHSPPEFAPARRGSSKKAVWIVVTIALLCVMGTGGLIFLRPSGGSDPFSDLVNKTVPQDQPPTEAEKEAIRASKQAEKDRHDQEERNRQEHVAADKAAKKKASDDKLAEAKLAAEQEGARIRQEAMDARAKVDREAKIAEAGPFAFIRADGKLRDGAGQWMFEIPKATKESHKESPIAGPVLCTSGNSITLSLPEGAAELFAACEYKIVITQDATNLDLWLANAITPNETIELATYTLEKLPTDGKPFGAPDRQLRFQWRESAERDIEAAELLRWWPLQIRVSGRTAVLLQRRSENPLTDDTRPTWNAMVASEDITLIRNAAINVMRFDKSPAIEFEIELAQRDAPTQRISVNLLSNAAEGDSVRSKASQNTALKYFQLAQPLRLKLSQPSPMDTPLGFGELQLNVSQSKSEGVKLKPRVKLKLRLPSEAFVEDLPDIKINDYLKQLIDTPSLLQQFNPTLTDAAVNALNQNADIFNRDISRWHTQQIRALPSLADFQKIPFITLKDRTIKNIHAAGRKTKVRFTRASAAHDAITPFMRNAAVGLPQNQAAIDRVDKEFNLASAEMAFAKQLGSKMPLFEEAMGLMAEKTRIAVDGLVQQHDEISVQLHAFDPKNADIQIRCTLSGLVSTPQCDNGESLRVCFFESTSPNWPAITTQPEAK